MAFDASPYRQDTYGPPTHYADCTKSLSVTGAGTLGNPWNLNQAKGLATAGMRIGILPISESVNPTPVALPTTSDDNTPAFNPTNSGTVGNPILFVMKHAAVAMAESGVTTNPLRSEFRHDGLPENGTSGSGSGCAMLGGFGRNYIIYDGFFIDMAQAWIAEDSGTLRADTSTGIQFLNFHIKGAAHTVFSNPVIYRPQAATNTVLRNFKAYDATNTGGLGQAFLFSDQYGDQNFTIEHFEIRNTQRGIFLKGTAPNGFNYGTIRYGIVRDVRSAYQFNDLHATQLTTLQYCLAYNIGQEGLGDGAIVFSSETSAGRNILIDHCTVAKMNATSINTNGNLIARNNGLGAGANGVTITNNLLDSDNGAFGHSVGFGTGSPASMNFNRYYKNGGSETYTVNGTQYNSFGAWQTAMQALRAGAEASSGELSTSPFTNRASNTFTIVAGHAAKTASSTGGEIGCYATSEVIGIDLGAADTTPPATPTGVMVN